MLKVINHISGILSFKKLRNINKIILNMLKKISFFLEMHLPEMCSEYVLVVIITFSCDNGIF